jgi:lipid A 3-O-deacylase
MDTTVAANRDRTNNRLLQGLRFLFSLALIGPASVPALAAESSLDASPIIAIGVLGHDQGPASDHNEHGIDLNVEAQFAPLDFFGSPRPRLGATLNFIGDTSVAYAGLTFPLYTHSRWFLDGSINAAVHNGPLHKDPVSCQLYSDCGFGSRVLPLFGVDVGYRLNDRSAVSLYYDHMSHKWVLSGENEGIDHIGLRYLWAF